LDSLLLLLASTVSTGLLLGAIFALVAAGVTIVYGCIWLPNASNGQFFILSGLVAWLLTSSYGLNSFTASCIVLCASVLLSLLFERLLFRRLYSVADRNISYFVITLGLTQIMSGLFSMTFSKWSDQFTLPPLIAGVTMIGPFPMTNNRILILFVAYLSIALLFILLRYHPIGRAIRAVFQNREAALLRGVHVHSIYKISFVLGSTIIYLGGLLYALAYSFDLSVAWSMSITAFAIMIVGGPGSVIGALSIGLVFGFTQAIVSNFTSPTVATFSYLIAMLMILLVRPNGLFLK
jgi:branched-chain amino acid transport system permease protein